MEYLTILAIIIGPTIGVIITLWSNNKKEKINNKMNIFLTLLAYRKSHPIQTEFINALNMINVVFHKDSKVISSWNTLFSSYNDIPFNLEISSRNLLNLLDAMAKSLGYLNIKQTDFDAFYRPIAETNKTILNESLNNELLRVLKNSQSFGTPLQPSQNNQKQS